MKNIKIIADSIPNIKTTHDCDLEICIENVSQIILNDCTNEHILETLRCNGNENELLKELIESNEDLLQNYFTNNINELQELCNNLGCGLVK